MVFSMVSHSIRCMEKVNGQPVVSDCPFKVKKQCGEGLFHQVLLAVLDDNSLIVLAYALS